jgi:tellurite resistance-related uncharacterized protein
LRKRATGLEPATLSLGSRYRLSPTAAACRENGSELARPLAISLPAVIQHLHVLESSGLVRSQNVVHDHVTWCVFGIIQGMEHEELFTLDEERGCLVEAGTSTNAADDVSGFAPPGDIHRVRNVGDDTAISIHIYGTDVSRIGSSVRRYYDQEVKPP